MQIPNNHYGEFAYRSNDIPDLPPMTISKDLSGFAERLPWGNTEPVLPLDLMSDTDLFSLKEQAKAYRQVKGLRGLYDEAFNHQEMRPLSFTKITSFWMYVYSFGKGLSYIMVIGVIFMYFLFYLGSKDQTLWEVFEKHWFGLLMIQLSPIGIWAIAAFYFKFFTIKKGQGAKWELSRQTGMVTVFKQEGPKGEKKRVAYSRPFYEFDAYLAVLPTQYGVSSYKLLLQHRYEDISLDNFMDNPSNSKGVVYANWDFIQNYMDVTQPLPDIGTLEMFRPYDPTTAEYDKQTGRDPRYWRDMDYDEWNQKFKEMGHTIDRMSISHRKNIMAKHVRYNF